ncbi:sensor histidine kinase [Paenibacillus guangzhouensis]|uniref:sensor histidine kinase n=1 Tax=Paenibacillus guangzhouensis TaxID=1473112 RepID=UPI0012670609|nr:HAMP domain-containing sensor histidine kinase [Paenibacillus guangzhouensis]
MIKRIREQLWFRIFQATITIIFFFVGSGAAAYGLYYWLRDKMSLPSSLFLSFLIIQFAALIIMATIAIPLAFYAKRKSEKTFNLVITALQRIAKGDFSAYINPQERVDDEFGQIITNINDMAVQLNELENMRQEFISNVSHEIQSPLTSIRGFARALQRTDLETDMRSHYLDIIETESVRLSKLSENLLKLTSLESKHHPFDPKPYRLDLQLKTTILACEPQWQEKQIEIEAEMPECIVTADEEMMSQVWINLIHNSIKFTPANGLITVRVEREQPNHGPVRVHITDTGIGMDAKAQKHIFERFYKADVSRNREIGGNGLGLSIVKRIIDMHEGSISVKSALGEGTTFTVVMPMPQAQSPPNNDIEVNL